MRENVILATTMGCLKLTYYKCNLFEKVQHIELDDRTFKNKEYHYGFQGQEKDDEVKGAGNSVNYEYRMHDPRLGRFFAIDPLQNSFPWNSSYAFSENNVIHCVELEGLERITAKLKFKNGKAKLVNYKYRENTTWEFGKQLIVSYNGENYTFKHYPWYGGTPGIGDAPNDLEEWYD